MGQHHHGHLSAHPFDASAKLTNNIAFRLAAGHILTLVMGLLAGG